MKLLIGADIVPTSSNFEPFKSGDVRSLADASLLEKLKAADFRVFNLEVPLTDIVSPISKCGPNLIAPTETIAGIKALGVDLFTLANNHILDQGAQGLRSTCALLRENQIAYLGAGETLRDAAAPYILDCGEKKIGFYACAEHEFSIATDTTPGANPFDPLYTLDHIAALKAQCDYVIVLYHGGKEHYRYPSPGLQKNCRRLLEKGADFVICQHSHCIGCEEKYRGGTIVYGQGNFLFDHSDSEYWKTSLLIELSSEGAIRYIPIVKDGEKVRCASGAEADQILSDFYARSEQIKSSDFVQESYAKFAKEMRTGYLAALSPISKNIFFRVLNRLSGYRFGAWYLSKKYTPAMRLAIRNFVECEAHRELLLRGMSENEKGEAE